jgi:hypothetical protein
MAKTNDLPVEKSSMQERAISRVMLFPEKRTNPYVRVRITPAPYLAGPECKSGPPVI